MAAKATKAEPAKDASPAPGKAAPTQGAPTKEAPTQGAPTKTVAEGKDLIVVGGGPGGYVAAIRAAQLGLKVAVVEKEHLGGICANWGCIPTKALLRSAELFSALKHGGDLGIEAPGLRFNYVKAIAHSRKVADNQNRGVGFLFKKNGIEWLRGTATVKRAAQGFALDVGGRVLSAPNILLATGARPRALPGIEPDGKQILTYFEAMNLPAQPQSLCIIGAGAIGVEFAYFYNAIGTRVTLIEALPTILPVEDREISGLLRKSLTEQGIAIHTGAKVTEVKKGSGEVEVRFVSDGGHGLTVRVEKVLSAVGVRGNSDGLGLEEIGAKLERTFLCVDSDYRLLDAQGAPLPGLFAIGDVVGGPLLAHKASAEGISCVENIARVPEHDRRRVDMSTMPAATFCRPEVGSMGLTEEKAREAGRAVKIGRFPFRFTGKGQATAETEGLAKVILDEKSGEILGAHVLGGSASDMIATLTVARAGELTATELLHTIFAHPTFSEALKGAVEQAYGEAIDL
jgi:dihydrolipoamide dehydrogenase